MSQNPPGAMPPPQSKPAPQRPAPHQFDSRALLGAAREVLIAHNGEHYHLRLTRAGKLILTK